MGAWSTARNKHCKVAGWIHWFLWPVFTYLQLCIQVPSFSHRTWLGGRVVEGVLHRI